MVERKDSPLSKTELRSAAEARLADQRFDVSTMSAKQLADMVHELSVHQIELELQNEEMQRAYIELEALRADLDDLYQLAPVGYITLSSDGVILQANRAAVKMLDLNSADVTSTRFYQHIVTEDQGIYFAHRRHLAKSGRHQHCELRIAGKRGARCDVRLDSLPKRDSQHRTLGYRTTLTDITRLKQTQRQLLVAASVIAASSEAVVVMDTDGRISNANPAFEQLTGASESKLQGQALAELTVELDGDRFKQVKDELLRTGHWAGELRIHGEDDDTPVWTALSAITDGTGATTHFAGILTDISRRKQAERRLYLQANYDSITNLPNRNLFFERLSQSAHQAHRNRTGMALLFLDLDRFKQVNDNLGHDVGDELLKQVAQRLQSCIRENDTLARVGGDEFAIVLADITDDKSPAVVAEKAIKQLGEPILINDHEVRSGASIGIAIYPDNTDDLDTLRRYADMAMYEAKNSGRNNYRFFTDAIGDAADAHFQVESELLSALRQGELRLRYQPIHDLAANRIVGVEALLRWRHPSRGLLRPASFIGAIEDTGLIRDVGDWVLTTACHDMQSWRHTPLGKDLSVFINVSGFQLNSVTAYSRLRNTIEHCSRATGRMVLEITESIAMDVGPGMREQLSQLRKEGIRLAMDDFGKGYSSLSSLKDLPFDILKIDKSFVADIASNRSTSALVDAIIAMAHGLGLTVIAEGVESAQQLELLRRKGCDAAQGYHLSRPMSAASFARSMLLPDAKAPGRRQSH